MPSCSPRTCAWSSCGASRATRGAVATPRPSAAASRRCRRMPGMERPPEPFSIEESRRDGTTVLTLHGELDLAYADDLTARLEDLRDRGEPVILDLDQLEFIDSSGLRVLLKATQDSENGAWRFRVTRGSEAVVRLLRAAGLEGRLPTVEGPVG